MTRMLTIFDEAFNGTSFVIPKDFDLENLEVEEFLFFERLKEVKSQWFIDGELLPQFNKSSHEAWVFHVKEKFELVEIAQIELVD